MLQFTLPPHHLVVFQSHAFLSLISVYFSDWVPLSMSSLSEEISSYKAAAISLQEIKMNYCCSSILFSQRPKGEMRKGFCSSFQGQVHRKYFGRGEGLQCCYLSQACMQNSTVGYRKYCLRTYVMQGSANSSCASTVEEKENVALLILFYSPFMNF